MNVKLLCRMLGSLLLLMALMMTGPVVLAAADGSLLPVAASAGVFLLAGLLLASLVGRKADHTVSDTASYHYTLLIWLLIPLFGALPYVLVSRWEGSGWHAGLADALFESVSGFTTTGSTIMSDADLRERLPRSLILWRAETQWMGGLGLVLLLVALSRRLRQGSAKLYDAEFSGTQQRRLHPRLGRSVSRMWQIYIVLTAADALLLSLWDDPFVAVCMAMSTISTGGFSPVPVFVTDYSSPQLYVTTFFMLASGVNVAWLYNFFTLRWRRVGRSTELRLYLVVYAVGVAATVGAIWAGGGIGVPWLPFSLFHVASTLSTTGFYTEHCMPLPLGVQAVTFALMVVGPMAGSTGGGLKLRRLMVLVQYLRNYFTRMIHPGAVFVVKVDGRVVEPTYVDKIFGFLFLFICFLLLGAFALCCCGLGLAESFALSAANLSNLGPSPVVGGGRHAV